VSKYLAFYIVRNNETVTFGVTEPLDCSRVHRTNSIYALPPPDKNQGQFTFGLSPFGPILRKRLATITTSRIIIRQSESRGKLIKNINFFARSFSYPRFLLMSMEAPLHEVRILH